MVELPTGRTDLYQLARVCRQVLGRPGWSLVAAFCTGMVLSVFAATTKPTYIWQVVLGGNLSPVWRVRALVAVFPLAHGSDVVQGALLYLLAGLAGLNFAILGFRLTHGGLTIAEGSGGTVGVVLGTLGTGCAPCGVSVLTGVLSMTGAATMLAAVPFGGNLVLAFSTGLVLLSTYWVTAGMEV